MGKVITTDSFIEEAKRVHGSVYDYSLLKYFGCKNKVKIICKIHGEFEQIPGSHLVGMGCRKCGTESMKSKRRLTIDEFVLKGNKAHNFKYNYSLFKYINYNTVGIIKCPLHGSFNQTPHTHLSGSGCPKCGDERSGNSKRINTSYFIKKAKEVHGDKYDYSKTKYKSCKEKVVIICNEHGEFKQIPSGHMTGKGCNLCGGGGFSTRKPAIFYMVEFDNLFKIGVTNSNLLDRYGKSKYKNLIIHIEEYFEEGIEAFNKELKIKQNNKKYLYNKVNSLTGTISNEVFIKNILN